MKMTFNTRKLESVLREVNRDLEGEGVLTERLTQDIWTKLMSNLLQGEYEIAFPIRQDLQKHIRTKRPDRIYTFNQIIHRLDEILDRYIPPPQLTDTSKDKTKGGKKGKQIRETVKTDPEQVKPSGKQDVAQAIYQESKRIYNTSTRNMNVQTSRHLMTDDLFGRERRASNREMAIQTSRVTVTEIGEEKNKENRFPKSPMKDESVETEWEEHYEEDEVSREQFYTMQANQSVLMKTVDDQQMKIKTLQESVTQLERKNMSLVDELQYVQADKGDKIGVYNKVEREIKFLRNELKIKERTLQLSLIERNELLDRLSAVTSSKIVNGNSKITDLSDVLRPTQIADKYSKLFDSEWTDAFHLLILEMRDEKTAIQWLFEILQDSYWFCTNTNESHTKLLIESLLHPFRRTSEAKTVDPNVLDDVTRTLVSSLKQSGARYAVSHIQVQFLQTMQKTKKTYYEDKTVKKLTSYIDKCVELCWYMVNQDPPVLIDEQLPKTGDEFDRDMYRFHRKSGSKVDYVVWPALYLGKAGYLLVQGVAHSKQEGIALRIASSQSNRSLAQ